LEVIGDINFTTDIYKNGVAQFTGTSNEYSNLTLSQGFINSNVLSVQTIPLITTNNIGIGITNPTAKINILNRTMTNTPLTTQMRVFSTTTNVN
jgi:hypothetical protein